MVSLVLQEKHLFMKISVNRGYLGIGIENETFSRGVSSAMGADIRSGCGDENLFKENSVSPVFPGFFDGTSQHFFLVDLASPVWLRIALTDDLILPFNGRGVHKYVDFPGGALLATYIPNDGRGAGGK